MFVIKEMQTYASAATKVLKIKLMLVRLLTHGDTLFTLNNGKWCSNRGTQVESILKSWAFFGHTKQ